MGWRWQRFSFQDLVWTGPSSEKFLKDKNGNILHESQTDYGMKRVEYVHKLFNEGLMNPEVFTMEENRAKEGIVNKSFAIVSDMHNYIVENNDMKYIPIGPIKDVNGSTQMQLSYKSGYAGWSIPATTKNPEEVVKFADWLASRDGKLLSQYGIEGRDYNLDKDGNPVVKKEVLDLKEKDPEKAKKLGFRGAGSYWAEHLGYTDIDTMKDFGEVEYGDRVSANSKSVRASEDIIKMYKFDEKLKNAKVIDGSTPKSFINEFDRGADLNIALDKYNEDLVKAYYAKSLGEAKQILDASRKNLENYGLEDFEKFVAQKEKEGVTIKY